MRKQDLVLGLVGVMQGCVPSTERDDGNARHFSGAEWVLDDGGNVVTTSAVLVERTGDGNEARVLRASSGGWAADRKATLAGSLRNGVFRTVELDVRGRRVLDLTPLSDQEFDDRVHAADASRAAH